MVKISELKEALRIDRFNLDTELTRQSTLYLEAAEAAAVVRSQLDQAKADLDNLEAALDRDLRLEAEITGAKTTEVNLSRMLQRHPTRIQAHKDYLELKLKSERLDQLREAYRQRVYMLREMVALYVSGYYADASVEGSKTNYLDAKVEQINRQLAEKRRARSGGRSD
jgi:hypothetical protein